MTPSGAVGMVVERKSSERRPMMVLEHRRPAPPCCLLAVSLSLLSSFVQGAPTQPPSHWLVR